MRKVLVVDGNGERRDDQAGQLGADDEPSCWLTVAGSQQQH